MIWRQQDCNWQRRRHSRTKKAELNAEINLVQCRLDVAAIRANPGTNKVLDGELAWCRRIDKAVPIKSKVGSKPLKIQAVCGAVDRFNAGLSVARLALEPEDEEGHDSDTGSDSDMD